MISQGRKHQEEREKEQESESDTERERHSLKCTMIFSLLTLAKLS
jgi:hypothetical protein